MLTSWERQDDLLSPVNHTPPKRALDEWHFIALDI